MKLAALLQSDLTTVGCCLLLLPPPVGPVNHKLVYRQRPSLNGKCGAIPGKFSMLKSVISPIKSGYTETPELARLRDPCTKLLYVYIPRYMFT